MNVTHQDVEEAFGHRVSGGSAGVNSATWYVCLTCGACVMESDRSDDLARATHLEWHAALPDNTEGRDG